MNDSQRGTVWEESIIHCPKVIQFAALSATVANAGQLTDWIQRDHGPTELELSHFRPVPLEDVKGRAFIRVWPIGDIKRL